jgi:hypothetical protein
MSESTSEPDLVTEAEFVDRPVSQKARSALHLYYNNASLDEIVTVVGFASIEEASKAIDIAVKAELRGDTKAKDRMRHIANRKLDQLLRSVSAKAANPKHPEHLAAVGKALNIIDRHIKLYGLDAPTEMIVHNPDSGEIEAWVMGLMNEGRGDLQEADILEGEVVSVRDDDDDGDAVPALVG